jgi:hypothetical protein
VATYLVSSGLVAAIGSGAAATVGASGLGAGVLGSTVVGGIVAHKISDSIDSDVWIERTENHIYNAPEGHEIIADPSTE